MDGDVHGCTNSVGASLYGYSLLEQRRTQLPMDAQERLQHQTLLNVALAITKNC